MSHTYSGDAGDTVETFSVGIVMGELVRMVGTSVWMIVLQGVLLIIHRSGTSRPRNGQPSRAEICVGITLLWAFQIWVGQMMAGIVTILSFTEFAPKGQWSEGNQDARLGIGGIGARWLRNGIVLLFNRVLITWYFHLGIIFLLDTWIPLWQELRQNPQKALQKLELRLKEILDFLESTFQDPFSDFSLLPRGNPEEILKCSNQAIHLERRQTDRPNEGQRRLSWNIVVDKDAMDEMKETLGPPGGFGELGFNVAKDGVRFEAMGVGTSFNLMFKLRQFEQGGNIKEHRTRKKHK